MDRAFALLHVKSFEPSGRRFSGIASTPTPDRVDDIIEPKGIAFKNPMPLLLFHNSQMPVGTVRFGKATDDGVTFEADIPEVTEPGEVKNLTDKAAHFVKYGLVRAVSIGFRALKDGVENLKTGGLRFTKTEVLELSLVPIPANAEALIHTIKSYDRDELAASGTGSSDPQHVQPAGVSATPVVKARQGRPVKTIQDQISSFEATRQAKDAERNGLMNTAAEKGETLDAEAEQKYDALAGEIKSVDAHLVRLRDLVESNKAAAVEVKAANTHEATQSRGGVSVSVNERTPPGIGMARLAMAKVCAKIDGRTVREEIEGRWPDDARLKAFITKAAVPAGTTVNATWAGNLVYAENLASEFIEFLRPQTLVGRIPNLRRVPFNVRITGQTTGAVANWVQQAKAKPVTSFSTTAITLGFTKIAAISVITEELARFSSPSAEMLVRDELARAVIERMDIDFIDPAQALVANVSPASITNGVTPLSSAGSSAANVYTDLQNLLEQFVANNMNTTNVVLIMPNTLALAASLMTTSLGVPEFPGLGINGGNLRGIPVITTMYAANQSGAGNMVIALDPSQIFLADDGQVNLSASTEASIEMSDAPANASDVPTGASLTSMWQTNSVAIKAERFINWAKARSTAVSYMDDVNWGSVGSPS